MRDGSKYTSVIRLRHPQARIRCLSAHRLAVLGDCFIVDRCTTRGLSSIHNQAHYRNAKHKMLVRDKENQILVSHKQQPWAGLEPATFLEVIFCHTGHVCAQRLGT